MDNHEHRYFIFEVKAAFEPIKVTGKVNSDGSMTINNYYERVEYAVMGCNCGDVIKRKVIQKDAAA